jgi:hypothetical protein
MEKQRKIISFENLSPELQQLLKDKYPNGFAGHTQRIETPKKESLNVIRLETADAILMVKVKVEEKKARPLDDDEDDVAEDFVPDTPAIDDAKDEFGNDDEEEDDYGDEPIDEDDDDEDDED